MEPETTCKNNDTLEKGKLYMALELSQKDWNWGSVWAPDSRHDCGVYLGVRWRFGWKEIRLAPEQFGLRPDVEVESCSEAGRDGFWLHRYLEAQGVKNVVVDSASLWIWGGQIKKHPNGCSEAPRRGFEPRT